MPHESEGAVVGARFAVAFVIAFACGGHREEPVTIAPTPSSPVASRLAPSRDPLVAVDGPIVGSVQFVDPVCKRREATGRWTTVDCPEDVLPAPKPGELVVSEDGERCFQVYARPPASANSWDQGRVRCPPNVTLPSRRMITVGQDLVRLDVESLTCSRVVRRYPATYRDNTVCPADLVPTLVGLEPDAPCSYRGVQVNCSVADAPDTARIIAVFARAGGSSFVISRGTTDHVVAGMKLRLGGVPEPATIEACDRRTCTATITVAPDLVKAARPVVTFLK